MMTPTLIESAASTVFESIGKDARPTIIVLIVIISLIPSRPCTDYAAFRVHHEDICLRYIYNSATYVSVDCQTEIVCGEQRNCACCRCRRSGWPGDDRSLSVGRRLGGRRAVPPAAAASNGRDASGDGPDRPDGLRRAPRRDPGRHPYRLRRPVRETGSDGGLARGGSDSREPGDADQPLRRDRTQQSRLAPHCAASGRESLWRPPRADPGSGARERAPPYPSELLLGATGFPRGAPGRQGLELDGVPAAGRVRLRLSEHDEHDRGRRRLRGDQPAARLAAHLSRKRQARNRGDRRAPARPRHRVERPDACGLQPDLQCHERRRLRLGKRLARDRARFLDATRTSPSDAARADHAESRGNMANDRRTLRSRTGDAGRARQWLLAIRRFRPLPHPFDLVASQYDQDPPSGIQRLPRHRGLALVVARPYAEAQNPAAGCRLKAAAARGQWPPLMTPCALSRPRAASSTSNCARTSSVSSPWVCGAMR